MRIIFVLAITILSVSCTSREEIFVAGDGVAINGYDAVAYFTLEKPVKGSPGYSFQWKNATWRFSSKENLDAFARNPSLYAPQYGGYCAYGMSNGYKASVDPEAWTIVNGKLYLNYNLDVREGWFKERNMRIVKADRNWDQLRDAPFHR